MSHQSIGGTFFYNPALKISLFKSKKSQSIKPNYKVPSCTPGTLSLRIDLFLFRLLFVWPRGLTCRASVLHWLCSALSSICFVDSLWLDSWLCHWHNIWGRQHPSSPSVLVSQGFSFITWAFEYSDKSSKGTGGKEALLFVTLAADITMSTWPRLKYTIILRNATWS